MQTEIGQIPNDWSVASLREVTDAARPISYGIVQTGPNLADGVPCIRVVDIDNGRLNTSGLIYTSEAISSAYKRTVLRAGDLIMPLRGKVGDVAEVGSTLEGANLTRGVALLSIRIGIVGSYCRHALAWPATRRRLEQSMNGSALQEIPIAALRTFQIALPREEQEQHAIATALSDVDALIAGLERLIAKKRDIKQATMQQLLTGQTRLPGFSGEWASARLGDLLSVCHGKNQREVEVPDGPYPILATGGRIGTACQPLHDRPSVLIGRKGTINKPQYMDTPFWTVDTLFYCDVCQPNSAKFLYYRFLLIDWMQYNEASGVPSLNGRTIERIEIDCPHSKEQIAIAAVLADMDADLSALEARLAKTRAIKQGMMQELLTGRTRLLDPETPTV